MAFRFETANERWNEYQRLAADPTVPRSKFVIYPCQYHQPQRGSTFDEGALDYGDVYLEEGGQQTLVRKCEGCTQGRPPTNQERM